VEDLKVKKAIIPATGLETVSIPVSNKYFESKRYGVGGKMGFIKR